MMTKVHVPIDYKPRVQCFKRKDRDRWILEYYLPATNRVKTSMTLPEGTTQARAKDIKRRKRMDLLNGILTEDEYTKLTKASPHGTLTIDQALVLYMGGTFLNKSEKNKVNERSILPLRFSYFKKVHSLTYIHEVKDEHILDYKEYLIGQITKKEIAHSTAQDHISAVKKVFNWLKENKKILVNPVADVKQIRVNLEDKVRSATFTQDQIRRVMEANYEAPTGLAIKALFLWMRETGCRIGEALHLEWDDVRDGVWHIAYKPHCPTCYGLGWKPKCGISRTVYLSPTAQEILKSLPVLPTVGYIQNDPTPYKANFVFVVQDLRSKDCVRWRRVDEIRGTWESLLKAAGVPYSGLNKLVPHDLRRTWNVEAKQFRGLSDSYRSSQMGNSISVNNSNYSGKADDELLRLRALLERSEGSNLLKFIRPEEHHSNSPDQLQRKEAN